jgi:hypothetical protein
MIAAMQPAQGSHSQETATRTSLGVREHRPGESPSAPDHVAMARSLQRAAGNRATTQLVQRGLFDGIRRTLGLQYSATIGSEQVLVTSRAEEQRARAIITEICGTYGIAVDSLKGATATKDHYANAPQAERDKVAARPWRLRELVAVKKALDHYAPILGKARKHSARSGSDQEITTLGKVTTSITVNQAEGVADPDTLGEFYRSSSTFSIYTSSETSTVDFPGDVDKQIEATTTHEIAHGLMQYMIDPFMQASGFWLDQNTKSGTAGAEAPPTKYGNTNAREDMAESVMLYFVAEDRLKSSCPKRHAAIQLEVLKWGGVGDFPTPDRHPTTALA